MSQFDIVYGYSKANNVETAVRQASVQVREKLSLPHIGTCLVLFNISDEKVTELPYIIKRILNPEQIIGYNVPLLIAGTEVFRKGIIIITFSGLRIVTGVSSKYGDVLTSSEKFVWKILKDAQRMRKSYFLSFSELNYSDSSHLLKGIERGIGRNTYFTGIFSCTELLPSFLLYNENLLNNCSVGMLFLDNTESFAEVGAGFNPLGKGGKITSYRKNRIEKIDNKPAIDFYRHYFGDRVVKDKDYYKTVTIRYPLGFKLENSLGYIITRPIKLNPDGSLDIVKDIISDEIKLMIPTRRLLIESLKESCRNLVQSMKNPKICLVFDSYFRYKLLGTSYSQQLRLAQSALGNVPLVGGVSFYNMGSASFSKIDLGHFIWENSFVTIGWGDK